MNSIQAGDQVRGLALGTIAVLFIQGIVAPVIHQNPVVIPEQVVATGAGILARLLGLEYDFPPDRRMHLQRRTVQTLDQIMVDKQFTLRI
jgi:hypothetical protein